MNLSVRDKKKRLRNKQDNLVALVARKTEFGADYCISEKEFAPNISDLNLCLFPEWELEIDEAIVKLSDCNISEHDDLAKHEEPAMQRFQTKEDLNATINILTKKKGVE